MKKLLNVVFITVLAFVFQDVYAGTCGDIYNISVSNGTVYRDPSNALEKYYIINLKDNVDTVKIYAETTNGEFVNYKSGQSFSTNGTAKIEVSGANCNPPSGIYTYYFTFKKPAKKVESKESTAPTPIQSTSPQPQPVIEESKEKRKPYLSELKVTGFDLNFSKEQYHYSFITEDNITTLNVSALPENNEDKVEISDNYTNIQDGKNTILVTVTTPENEKNVYTIVITKNYQKSSNTKLKSLVIENHLINFDPNETEYTVNIGNEKKLNITAVADSNSSKVTIKNNNNLKNNSVVTVTVTAEDGSKEEYRIKIQKKFSIANIDIVKYSKYIIYGAIGLFIIILIIILVSSSKKRKRKQKKVEDNQVVENNFQIDEEKLKVNPYVVENNVKQEDVNAGAIVKNEVKNKKNKKTYDKIDPNANSVNVDEHIKFIQPTDVQNNDVEKGNTEVFKVE